MLESLLDLLLLTADPHPGGGPALVVAACTQRAVRQPGVVVAGAGNADVAIVDARTDLVAARGCAVCWEPPELRCRWSRCSNEGGLVAVNLDWGLDEILLPSTGPAEIDTRLRLLTGRRGGAAWPGECGQR